MILAMLKQYTRGKLADTYLGLWFVYQHIVKENPLAVSKAIRYNLILDYLLHMLKRKIVRGHNSLGIKEKKSFKIFINQMGG